MAYLADEFLECVSHSALVCGQSIASTLWHDGPFVEAPWCLYSSEVNVVRVYLDLEEGICHAHAKYFPLPTFGKYIINAGEGEVVSHLAMCEGRVDPQGFVKGMSRVGVRVEHFIPSQNPHP